MPILRLLSRALAAEDAAEAEGARLPSILEATLGGFDQIIRDASG